MSLTCDFQRALRRVRSIRLQFLAIVTVTAVVALAPRSGAAQPGYLVQDLGVLAGDTGSVAMAINANGDVVGWSDGPNGARAVVFRADGVRVALPGLPDRPRTLARDINDAGDVVGNANAGGTDAGLAVLWSGGVIRNLGTLGTGAFSEAWAINNLGQIVGTSSTSGSGLSGTHGFLYTEATGLIDLTPGSDQGAATDINDAGQVTGYKTAVGGYHAFRWNGGFLDLGVLPTFAHSFGWAINASGQVAGNSTSASGDSQRRFRYTDGVGLEDLGGAGQHNDAWGINAAGDVVGCTGQSFRRALRYTDQGGVQDLNTLIDPSLGWVLLCAHDINDAGQIAAYGFNNFTGRTTALRLVPLVTPPPVCTFRCLLSTAINLRARRGTVEGSVTVQDESGRAVAQAMVYARWTLPDGSSAEQTVATTRNGVATFRTTGGQRGLYTLTVANIVLSQYTFDPARSVLTGAITVGR